MTFSEQLLGFLKDQGPAVLILCYSYLNGRTIRAEQATKTLELQNAIKDAHAKIDALNVGKSSSAIIDSVIGPDAKLQS